MVKNIAVIGDSESIKLMTEKMNEAAENLEFELAAKLRDRIKAIEKITEKQKVIATGIIAKPSKNGSNIHFPPKKTPFILFLISFLTTFALIFCTLT